MTLMSAGSADVAGTANETTTSATVIAIVRGRLVNSFDLFIRMMCTQRKIAMQIGISMCTKKTMKNSSELIVVSVRNDLEIGSENMGRTSSTFADPAATLR